MVHLHTGCGRFGWSHNTSFPIRASHHPLSPSLLPPSLFLFSPTLSSPLPLSRSLFLPSPPLSPLPTPSLLLPSLSSLTSLSRTTSTNQVFVDRFAPPKPILSEQQCATLSDYCGNPNPSAAPRKGYMDSLPTYCFLADRFMGAKLLLLSPFPLLSAHTVSINAHLTTAKELTGLVGPPLFPLLCSLRPSSVSLFALVLFLLHQTAINPHLGTPEELKALVDAAHAMGFLVMIDGAWMLMIDGERVMGYEEIVSAVIALLSQPPITSFLPHPLVLPLTVSSVTVPLSLAFNPPSVPLHPLPYISPFPALLNARTPPSTRPTLSPPSFPRLLQPPIRTLSHSPVRLPLSHPPFPTSVPPYPLSFPFSRPHSPSPPPIHIVRTAQCQSASFHPPCEVDFSQYDADNWQHCWLASLPDFNQSNPAVAAALVKSTAYLVHTFSFDAIRVDAAHHMPPEFVRSLASHLRVPAFAEVSIPLLPLPHRMLAGRAYTNHATAELQQALQLAMVRAFTGGNTGSDEFTHSPAAGYTVPAAPAASSAPTFPALPTAAASAAATGATAAASASADAADLAGAPAPPVAPAAAALRVASAEAATMVELARAMAAVFEGAGNADFQGSFLDNHDSPRLLCLLYGGEMRACGAGLSC
ncbi:unnamed protein product [Closterium sp. NIES-54]